jgi:uncharacterized protein with von Willebrand factor type A (vWA) domain
MPNTIAGKIQEFITDLRYAGLIISPSEAEDCYKALLSINWSDERSFYTALACTLLKEQIFIDIFNEIYAKHFYNRIIIDNLTDWVEQQNLGISLAAMNQNSDILQSRDIAKKGQTNKPANTHYQKKKNLFSLDFYEATYLTPIEDIREMETLIPLLAKKISSKIVVRKKRNQRGQIDYRQTIRTSLKTGGVPIDIRVKKKYREKPVIFALCDVSRSCLYFSFFSLAIVHMLENFFREVRSFAFIEKVDEITTLVKESSYEELRPLIMANANVTGPTGYTDYGNTLTSFYDQYSHELSHKSTVIIFGDARNNWFNSNADILEKISKRVKKVYWFNPESKDEWQTGDSDMIVYKKYCTRVFVCSNLNQLADAICEL